MQPMPERPGQENQAPPGKQESLQYVTYSAKELLYILTEKIDKLDGKVDALVVEQARLDSRYVSQVQLAEFKKEASVARRFAIASTIASVGAFGTFVGLIVS